MNFKACVVAGNRVYGEEARIQFEGYVEEGIQYVAIDNSEDGKFGGMIRLFGISAVFSVEFDSMEEGIAYLSRAGRAA